MSGFSFPPPPPAPPKANAINGQQSTPQRGGGDHQRGRGARGNFQSRGRGQSGGRGQSQSQGGRRQPYQNANASPLQSQSASHSTYGYADKVAYPSAPTLPQRPSWSSDQHTAGSPSRTAAGHKRKLDALREPPQKKPEEKGAPATAPAIPTFGAPFLTAPSSIGKKNSPPASNGHPQQKALNRSLGLTPGTGKPQYSSSDNEDDGDDLDEEAMYAELGDKLSFEHNGVVMSLNSQADLLAWKKDRQKNWPTKARMATKDEERRRVGKERKRLLAGVEALYGVTSRFSKPGSNIWTSVETTGQDQSQEAEEASPSSVAQTPETNLEKTRREMAEKTKRLEELRRKVAESETRNRKARERAERSSNQEDGSKDLTPPNDGEHEETAVPTAVKAGNATQAEDQPTPGGSLDDSSSLATSSASDASGSSEEDDSDDESPEETTLKPSAEMPFVADERPVCRYFRAGGWCRDGDACKFKHDAADQRPHRTGQQQAPQRQGHVRKDQRPPKLEQKSEKKTIFQRLMEQEEAEVDRLALNAVKYLGEAGFFQ